MLSEENRRKIQDFVAYWVTEKKRIREEGLYYSVSKEDGGKDFNYPALSGYLDDHVQVSHLDLVAEALGMTEKDIAKVEFFRNADNQNYFVYLSYMDFLILGVLDEEEYKKFMELLKENERRKNDEC